MDIRSATALAGQVENVAEFCRREQISRQTLYKWRARFHDAGLDGLKCLGRGQPDPADASGDRDDFSVQVQVRGARSFRESGVPAEEFDLQTQRVVEGDATLLHAVVAALAAVQFGVLGLPGHPQSGCYRSLPVGFGDDEQNRYANGPGAADRPVHRDAQQCERAARAVVPVHRFPRGHHLFAEQHIRGVGDAPLSRCHADGQVDRGSPDSEPIRSATATATDMRRIDRLGRTRVAPASPSTSGHWATAPASRESDAASAVTCMPANDVPHAKIRCASMLGCAAAQPIAAL
jgi:hypothetical protein